MISKIFVGLIILFIFSTGCIDKNNSTKVDLSDSKRITTTTRIVTTTSTTTTTTLKTVFTLKPIGGDFPSELELMLVEGKKITRIL